MTAYAGLIKLISYVWEDYPVVTVKRLILHAIISIIIKSDPESIKMLVPHLKKTYFDVLLNHEI